MTTELTDKPVLKIFVRDSNRDFIEAFHKELEKAYFPYNLEVQHEDIFDRSADAIVSPANSFGFMEGGVDGVYARRWPKISQRVQNVIRTMPFQELLIGQAVVVETDDTFFPWLIAAPTMRVPRIITDAADIFLATRAAMAVAEVYGFKSIVFPGMGTGTGALSYNLAARAMLKGFDWQRHTSFPPSNQKMSLMHYAYTV